MTEDQLKKEALSWLAELGYAVHSGYDGVSPQRANYCQVVLPFCLREHALQGVLGNFCIGTYPKNPGFYTHGAQHA